MSAGNLIHMPHSELNTTIELLDHLGVTPEDFKVLRKASSWDQQTTARILKADPRLWAMLAMEGAAKKAGFSEGDFKKLAGSEDMLRQMLQVARGYASVTMIEHLIDCDTQPFIPDGLSLHEEDQIKSRVRGKFAWDPTKVELWLARGQQNGKWLAGNKLRKELDDKPVLPANVLDYFLANQHLIPEEWKKDEQGNTRYVYFWGTIYRDSVGSLCVRYLCWGDGGWRSGWSRLDYDWSVDNPAALRAS